MYEVYKQLFVKLPLIGRCPPISYAAQLKPSSHNPLATSLKENNIYKNKYCTFKK